MKDFLRWKKWVNQGLERTRKEEKRKARERGTVTKDLSNMKDNRRNILVVLDKFLI